MNGYVVAWMALSPFAGPSLAIGILTGRKMQHRDSYRSGLEAGRMMAEYARQQGPTPHIDAAQVKRWQTMLDGHTVTVQHRPGQGHDGECTHERGCW